MIFSFISFWRWWIGLASIFTTWLHIEKFFVMGIYWVKVGIPFTLFFKGYLRLFLFVFVRNKGALGRIIRCFSWRWFFPVWFLVIYDSWRTHFRSIATLLDWFSNTLTKKINLSSPLIIIIFSLSLFLKLGFKFIKIKFVLVDLNVLKSLIIKIFYTLFFF